MNNNPQGKLRPYGVYSVEDLSGESPIEGVVDVTGGVSVTNTPSVNQGTSPWVVSQNTTPWIVSGGVNVNSLPSVSVNNFPAVQRVSGSVTVLNGGGSSSGGAVTIADGADTTLGSLADIGVGDASGSVNAHLRQLVADIENGISVTALVGSLPNNGFTLNSSQAGTIANQSDAVTLFQDGAQTYTIGIDGAFAGSIIAVAFIRGLTVFPYPLIDMATGASLTTITTSGKYYIDAGGLKGLQIYASTWTSGSVEVYISAATGYHGVSLGSPNDTAVTGDNPGTISAKLRGISSQLNSGIRTIPTKSATATRTSVLAATGTTTILAANTNRLGAAVFNNSSSNLYLSLGSAGSTTNFTTLLAQNAYYEVPFSYTGALTGVWSIATGNALVTELT